MGYQEKSNVVSLLTNALILGYYLTNLSRLIATERFTTVALFSLWATIIVAAILANIIATVITQIVFSIILTIRTNEEEHFYTDERDKLIDLQGVRNAYVVQGVGIFIAMVSFVLGEPALVMFALLVVASLLAELVGDLSRVVLYRSNS